MNHKIAAICDLRRRMVIFLEAKGVEHNPTGKEKLLLDKCYEALKLVRPPQKAKARQYLSEILPATVRPKQIVRPVVLQPTATPIPWPPKVKKNFYDTDDWRRLRYRVLKANNGCCKCCGVSAADGAQLHVDHIKPRSKFPDLELEFTNMQVLCRDCNLGKGAWDETDWRAAAAE